MHATTKDPRASERGQALAVFSGGLVTLLVAGGLVLDGGLAFVNKRDAQNAADFGALAGTQAVADFHIKDVGTGTAVHAAIDEAVQANGCDPGASAPCSWTAEYVLPTTGYQTVTVGSGVNPGGAIPATAQGVEVCIQHAPEAYLLKIIGQADWQVTACATAVTSRLDQMGESILLPIAFDPGRDLTYEEGKLKNYKFSEDKDGPGNFSWLSWYDINSAVELEKNVCNPNNPEYLFPVYVPGGPGKMTKNGVRDCLDSYIGKTVFVPLWDDCTLLGDTEESPGYQGNGANGEYCVIGVAGFELMGYSSNPAIDDIWGSLRPWVSYTSIPANWSGPPCDISEDGCFSPTNYLGLIK